MKKSIIAAGISILALGSVAYAAPGMMNAGPITQKDAQARSAEMFDRMDANGDGKIDQADRDARRAERFAMMDTDGDGSISKSEFEAMHENRQHRGHGMHDGGHHDGHRAKHGGGMGMMGMMGMMADANGDGVITRAEFDAGVKAHFAMMDANGDGTVTAEERQAARAKMGEAHKAERTAPPAKSN